MSSRPPFRPENMTYAYQLHYHLGFRTKYRTPVFGADETRSAFWPILAEICSRNDYHLLTSDFDECFVRLLLSLRPNHAPAEVVQAIKANSSRHLLDALPDIESLMGERRLWARGYYLRSVGDSPAQAIREYIRKQRQHHGVEEGSTRLLARHSHPAATPFYELRSLGHCVTEYNCHFVFSARGHVPVIEESHADGLLRYLKRVAETRQFVILELSILSDHVHMLAALRPTQSPEQVALTVMNNTHHWMKTHDPAVFRAWDVPGFWECSAFARAAGAATTAQVSAFLRGRAERDTLDE